MDAFRRTALRAATLALTVQPFAVAMADTTYLPPIHVDSGMARDYHCQQGKSLQVSYYNQQGGQSFAVLTLQGQRLLFVDTVAASGVRYVAGRYVWWTKGDRGDLYDIMADANAPPLIAGCVASAAQR